ncbi:cobalamin B12-binding domain-containing protein [Thiocapsa rosea]|uniref:Methanogenic corrinoid protein MtbC1 n=1 Tax=Thiocapsa rosea TaxID=69360 RepID=A0A495V2R7_9GAMM|nr:cobalamin-dependent protein [Thiocapsa rosea]RKT42863.1 methanogenic corrinoid protein MtbC1 [Thiocapsa rosea]
MLHLDPGLPSVPRRAADSFDANTAAMAGRVSQLMAGHSRLDAFLNGLPFRLIESNHRNHAAFMSEVLRTNNLKLLADTLPWAYFAYTNQGVSVDYFAAELEIWSQVITELLPGEDAEAILPIYRWMLRVHPETVDAAAHYASEAAPVPADHAAIYVEILERLIAGDHPAVIERCRALLREGMSFSRLLQSIFYPAMVEIGVRWEQGRLSVLMEHQATAMVYRILSALYYEQPFPSERRGRVLVASVTDEFHELGAWMVTTCLDLDGWNVTYLPRDCPLEQVVTAAVERTPAFVALSVGMPGHVQSARETVSALREALGPGSPTKILVGGRAFNKAPSLVESVGADLFLTDCEAAVAWARTLEAT